MFIYKKLNASGSTTVQIISKKNGKNYIVKTVGTSKDPEKINSLYQDAHSMLPSLLNQLILFPDLEDEKVKLVRELGNDDIRVCDPYSIFGRIFDHLGFSKIKDELFRDLVISRITHPGSKLRLREMLAQSGRKDITVDSIYRFMDKLSETYQSQVEHISFSHTKKLLGGSIGAVFYDMTTIYFESSKPDELRATGFSKDGKHQHPQIYLGLLVGSNGYPIGYNIFEGNIYEGHTLIPMIESFEHRFKLDKPVIVADSGLLSKKNIESLQQKKYAFILGARIKNEGQKITTQIESLKLENGGIAEIDKGNGLRLIISYSDKRAKKDFINRERGLKRLEKSLNTGKLTKSNINNRGYNKYLKMEGDISIAIDYLKFESDEKWDG
jgi:transposase